MTRQPGNHTWSRTLLLGLLITLPSAALGQSAPVINEFVTDHAGSDTSEFIEIFGDPVTDYSSFTVLEIEGDGGGGTVDGVFPVGTTDAAGFALLGFLQSELENGTLTLLLVRNFSGRQGDDLDVDDDGNIDVMPFDLVVDDVALSDGGSGDITYSAVVLEPGFDGDPTPAGGASRIPNGSDTDNRNDWVRNDFDGAGLPGLAGTPEPGEALNTPGVENQKVSGGLGGTVSGLTPALVVCRNWTTGQMIALEGETSWDCARGGLLVSPGDVVLMLVAGSVD